jgi:hypothetical protein
MQRTKDSSRKATPLVAEAHQGAQIKICVRVRNAIKAIRFFFFFLVVCDVEKGKKRKKEREMM